MIANVPRTEARMMISVLRDMPVPWDEAAVEVDKAALCVAVDATSTLPVRLSVSEFADADRIEEIAIVFVIIDVAVDNVDDDFFDLIVPGDSEDDVSDIEDKLLGTSI